MRQAIINLLCVQYSRSILYLTGRQQILNRGQWFKSYYPQFRSTITRKIVSQSYEISLYVIRSNQMFLDAFQRKLKHLSFSIPFFFRVYPSTLFISSSRILLSSRFLFLSFVFRPSPHPTSVWHCQPIPSENSNGIVASNVNHQRFCIFHRTSTIWITMKFTSVKSVKDWQMKEQFYQVYQVYQWVSPTLAVRLK